MFKNSWFRIGLIGTVVAAICCFTPVAVIALGVLGLGAYVAWLDPLLIPALIIFAIILVVGIVRVQRNGE